MLKVPASEVGSRSRATAPNILPSTAPWRFGRRCLQGFEKPTFPTQKLPSKPQLIDPPSTAKDRGCGHTIRRRGEPSSGSPGPGRTQNKANLEVDLPDPISRGVRNMPTQLEPSPEQTGRDTRALTIDPQPGRPRSRRSRRLPSIGESSAFVIS